MKRRKLWKWTDRLCMYAKVLNGGLCKGPAGSIAFAKTWKPCRTWCVCRTEWSQNNWKGKTEGSEGVEIVKGPSVSLIIGLSAINLECFSIKESIIIVFRGSEPVLGASQVTPGKGPLSSPLSKEGAALSMSRLFCLIVSKSLYRTLTCKESSQGAERIHHFQHWFPSPRWKHWVWGVMRCSLLLAATWFFLKGEIVRFHGYVGILYIYI